ncbi:MAG: HAMP domain-containing protein [Okeania sp. SIO2C9]|uniref:HAMP domain-containing protein n=1 Tax=Okeania sp. SIO2C9 TaxID=2607791 RepID=UPI0013C22A53|nr:HAMP domain-containing protein [Okeania sp. SIO2C9]NEQ73035.1 HAMP domain-containing protein [Okeania sp. SIO2C9]
MIIFKFIYRYGLARTVAIAIPKSDFMKEINTNTHQKILLSLAALGAAIFIDILTFHWVPKPILRLNYPAQNITGGKLNSQIEINRRHELGELELSLNQMATQLKEYFENL